MEYFTPSYFPTPNSLCWALEQRTAYEVDTGSCCVKEQAKKKKARERKAGGLQKHYCRGSAVEGVVDAPIRVVHTQTESLQNS